MINSNSQSGQALPIGMALMLVLALMSFVLLNTGQTITEKTRVVNTADAAVYSGLLWQARAMNFQAYTNRAMIANQVAMAQAVSINSWSAYIKKTGNNLNDWFGWIPYVGTVTNIIDQVGEAIDMFLNPISQGMLKVVDVVNSGLSIAQEGMYMASFLATPDVVDSIVKSNARINGKGKNGYDWKTEFSLASAAYNLNEWRNLTEKFDTDNTLAMKEREDIIRASTDRFTRSRDWKFFNFFIPISPMNWVRFEKAGTTELIHKNGKYEWKAKDALSLREKRYTWRGKKYKDLPISGGSSFANSDGSSRSIDNKRFFGGRHRYAQDRDYFLFHEGRDISGYSGIRAYRSLSTEWRNKQESPTLQLRLEIAHDVNDIEDARTLVPGGDLSVDVKTPAHVMTSVSTAELYFDKPCFNESCTEEYANGYSPYWDVRLVNTSGLMRLAAYSAYDLGERISDKSHIPSSDMHKLPSSMATPITDYKEQAKGLNVVLAGMEGHLDTLVSNSDEYKEYEQRILAIKDNINAEIDDIAAVFTYEDVGGEEVVEMLAKAAGYDFSVEEYSALLDPFDTGAPITSLDELKSQMSEMGDQVIDEQKQKIEAEIKQVLKNAVKDILAGMITSYASQYTGMDLDSGVIGSIAGQASDKIVDSVVEKAADDDDIKFDMNNECDIFAAVNAAETEVDEMQKRLETINQTVADRFHEELKKTTGDILLERENNNQRIEVLLKEIADFSGDGKETDNYEAPRRAEIAAIRLENRELPEKRVEQLTRALMRISDDATRAEFPDFRLQYRFARRAVVNTLQDINNFDVDETGAPVSDELFFADAEEELASDGEQNYTEKPEGC